jgi:translocation and assembly module TamA
MRFAETKLSKVESIRRLRVSLFGPALLSLGIVLAAHPVEAFELFGLKFFEGDKDELPITDPVRYSVTLDTGDADKDLAGKLKEASNLVADEEDPVSGSLGVLTKARNDRERLIAILYADARYDGVVNVSIEGKSIDELPPDAVFDTSRPVPVSIRVTPGGVFTLGEVTLKGDAARLDPAQYDLARGKPAGSEAILAAEARMVKALREEGRPLAKVTGREIVADHATMTLDVAIDVAAGPVAPYGDTSVEGTERVDRDFVAYMTNLKRGKQYSPQEIEDATKRLRDLEVFSGVAITTPDALDSDGSIPLNVQVSERKHRYFGAGVTYSSTDGAGVEGYWGHRNLFGRAEKLRISGSISRIGDASQFGELDFNSKILFEKPGVIGPASKFIADAEADFEHPDAYDKLSFGGGIGLTYDFTRRQTGSAQLRFEWADIEDTFGPGRYLLVSLPLQYVFDARDDKLNPKTGYRLMGRIEPTYDILSSATFFKADAEASAYRSLDSEGRFVVAAKVAGGTIFGAGLAAIPADRRFYAGGGGSVRGYAYQGVGPRAADGTPTGGLSFALASAEMRVAITETLGIVPFIDAGTVSTGRIPNFSDMRFGAGVGLRYMTPFGPLRIDGAIPLNRQDGDPRFGIYAGIGQAF